MRGPLRIESSTLARIGLAAMMILTAAVILRETRGNTFWVDEWTWALERRGGGVDTLLKPHNGHLSLVPILIYKALFATAGLDHYAPYRVMIAGAHVGLAGLVFVYARRRLGPLAALVPAALLLTLGPAWQNFLWPFQVAWLISLSAAIGALLALDRGDRRGDALACGLLALALASSGLGIVVAAGLLVELGWGRRNWRSAWIVAGPLAVYAVWWLAYQDTAFFRHNVVVAPRFAADAAGGALAAVAGLTEERLDANGLLIDAGAALSWGRPLALAAAALLIWRLASLRPVPVRVLTLLALAGGFWLLTGVQRSEISSPDASRYLYVGALFVLLLAVELLRGVALRRGVVLVIVAAAGLAIVANLGHLRSGARFLRFQAPLARADLGALELARASVPPGYNASSFPGVPFVVIGAGDYFRAAREDGSPAFTLPEIATAPEHARLTADAELMSIHRLALRPTAAKAGGAAPTVDVVSGGTVRMQGGCVRFWPSGVLGAGARPELQLTVPAGGILLRAEGGPAKVALRRFAATFPPNALAQLTPGVSGVLQPEGDRAIQPWHVRVTPEAAASACGVRSGA